MATPAGPDMPDSVMYTLNSVGISSQKRETSGCADAGRPVTLRNAATVA